ncbi:PAS domain-containing sensor histidine kinase [Segetibacter sp.]|uniref:sensor histidine kinase n=1 Tax=Segetibacter sp. TaxID=2231182 RepID=UPI00260F6A76|nr:PAS domain-containing sensor histidine kinase [Segetibacter sp.]MCW3081226.1 sensor histidine kinase [Segetibacter sp.]
MRTIQFTFTLRMNNAHNLISITKRNPFELFFELSADLLCIAGFDGYFKQINPAVSKLLGYTNEELMSRPINDFVHNDDKGITGKVRSELIKGNALFHFENRYVTKSGETVWLAWTSMNIDSDKMVFAIAKNITHKKKLEEDRNMLLANMTRVNKELKKLTYTTSHDLRAPVNNLLSIFDLLDISKITDEESLELIHILKAASESLKHTLNGYVDILSEKESINVPVEELDLKDVLDIVLESISSLIKTSKTIVKVNFSELAKVKFNKAYLHSIFLNLLTNAIKYAKTDCSPVITIVSKKVNGISQLTIEDNCVGFDMENVKEKVFGLHQKFHEHSDSKGIGLYLVYNHITSLGGTIALESKVNAGSKFIISFKDC